METVTISKNYTHKFLPDVRVNPFATITEFKQGQVIKGNWNYSKSHFMVNGRSDLTIPSEYILLTPDIDLTQNNYKFAPKTSEESRQIQEILISEGFTWSGGTTVAFLDAPYLYTEIDGQRIAYGTDSNMYYDTTYIELTLQDLQNHKGISMNIRKNHKLEALKSATIDMQQFLYNGDRVLVVTTLEEAEELKHLTGVDHPWDSDGTFENSKTSYGYTIAYRNSYSWNHPEYYKSNLPDHLQLTLEDVKYLLDTTTANEEGPIPEEHEVWHNPKPSKKNTQPIKKGDYYVCEGCKIPLVAPTDTKEIPIDGYPLHKLHHEQKPKVGDIAEIDSQWIVVKNREAIKNLKTLQEDSNTTVNLWRITDENNKAIQVMNINRYTCGTIVDNTTNKVLPTIPAGVKIDTDYSHDFTWEHKQISDHFNITIDNLEAQDELLHTKLSTILDHPLNISRKEWAYIWGPSGSGKSTLAVDYANNTNKPYILQQGTAQLTVDDLLGYKSITTGKYFSSLLRDAVENGKVFILDEADACNANTLLCLNALKQETFQFPDKLVTIHPDFRLIMTANTYNDYSDEYSSRNPLDKATLDRCAIINYDMKDYHLALRYGLKHIKQITDLDTKSPRQIEREVISIQIKETT